MIPRFRTPHPGASSRRFLYLLLGLGILAADRGGPRTAPGPVGRFELPGFDFRRDGAWRNRTTRVRELRRSLLRDGRVPALNRAGGGADLRVQGVYHVPVVPITFGNVAPPFPASDYQQVLFSNPPSYGAYSVTSYYAEASRGAVEIDGTVFDWATADSSDTYYEDGCNGVGVLGPCPHGGARFAELLVQALTQVDGRGVDWGAFDNDGPDGLPNSGDDDGAVDFVTFLQPEVDGACGTTNLWAHRFDLAGWLGGAGFRTSTPVLDASGTPVPGRFIMIRDYTLQSAVGGPGACASGAIMPIGTVSHETGHAFGLPDLYDTDLRNPGVTQGIGEWGIMGSGNYTQPYSPSAFEAWSLVELGWVTVDTLPASGWVSLPPVASSNRVYFYPIPATDEYYLLENRQALGSDSAQINPACQFGTRTCAKGPGLLIWHVDAGQVAAHGYRFDNRVNVGTIQGVALEQADGLNQLRVRGSKNRGDAGDPYPGSSGATRFGPYTWPGALDNQGRTSGIQLDSIREVAPGGDVAFFVQAVPPGQVSVILADAASQLLGHGRLLSAQLLLLDSLGNHNGRYDTGDFVALFEADPPPALRGGAR